MFTTTELVSKVRESSLMTDYTLTIIVSAWLSKIGRKS